MMPLVSGLVELQFRSEHASSGLVQEFSMREEESLRTCPWFSLGISMRQYEFSLGGSMR